ncbi:MAG: hypothetical protein KatS3mg093_129 [Candidatus Parcubacteria bacterium]|nr:MAG: hypothetical protein KatS3mg093_129 [Candidatus Parcubacteria bacterium]
MVKKFFALVLFFSIWFNVIFGASGSGFERAQNYIITIIERIIRFLFSVFIIVSSILLIYLGILYIVFGKTEAKVIDQSIDLRKSFLFIIIGLAILILSFFFPNIIKNFIENTIK